MRTQLPRLSRWLVSAGLAGAALLGAAATSTAQPVVRDHRQGPRPDQGPREAPPPRGEGRMAPRPGFVWIRGHWDWQNGQYAWVAGRYEPVRNGRRWRDVRWEQRGGEWVRVDGDWEEVPLYPTAAPPPPREE